MTTDRSRLAALRGHLETLAPVLRHLVRPHPEPPHETPFTTKLDDPVAGRVTLSGRLSVPPGGAREVVVVQHGLGGCIDSGYVRLAAQRAVAAGLACLRLNARGADPQRPVDDFGHAGLSADLRAALGDDALRDFDARYVLGFSMGGHQALRLACEDTPGLRAVAALSPPLDLGATRAHLDAPARTVYRHHILRSLKRSYRELAESGRTLPTPLKKVLAARTFLEWDARTVAPRHGFEDAFDYYRRASVGACIEELAVPALVVACPHDPMIPWAAGLPVLQRAPGVLTLWTSDRGGHCGFRANLFDRVIAWLRQHA